MTEPEITWASKNSEIIIYIDGRYVTTAANDNEFTRAILRPELERSVESMGLLPPNKEKS